MWFALRLPSWSEHWAHNNRQLPEHCSRRNAGYCGSGQPSRAVSTGGHGLPTIPPTGKRNTDKIPAILGGGSPPKRPDAAAVWIASSAPRRVQAILRPPKRRLVEPVIWSTGTRRAFDRFDTSAGAGECGNGALMQPPPTNLIKLISAQLVATAY